MTSQPLHLPPETIIVFVVLATAALFIDLIAHRKDHAVSLKSATLWSCFWILCALFFAGFLYLHHGTEVASLFLTGYALEKVLSVDNLFLIMAIFTWFKIPNAYRHRVLYWGVIGAIIFRGIFVAIGTSLLALGAWVEILFAMIVLWTAVMMLRHKNDEEEIEDYSNHLASRLVKRLFPVWPRLVGHAFFITAKTAEQEMKKPAYHKMNLVIKKGAIYATPLFLCTAVIELSDVMFAFDSVPVIIAVSREPLIVYSAMMFAILGLRSLYFVLEALRQYLVHLEKAVVFLLFFVSFKLLLNATDHVWHHGVTISAIQSLCVVLATLLIGILASFIFPSKKQYKTH